MVATMERKQLITTMALFLSEYQWLSQGVKSSGVVDVVTSISLSAQDQSETLDD